MARPISQHPTELELQVLKVLWDQSPLPVRDVRQALADQGRDLAHTTVITTLNTLVGKKYLSRKMDGKSCLFTPRLSREDVSQRMLGDVVNRLFDGSAKAVMLSLFESADLEPQDLAELRRLINQKAKK